MVALYQNVAGLRRTKAKSRRAVEGIEEKKCVRLSLVLTLRRIGNKR